MKRESRILIITHPDKCCPCMALVVRGSRGLDKIVLHSSSRELVQELLSDSILGEVSYIYIDVGVDSELLKKLYEVKRFKTLQGSRGMSIVSRWLDFARHVCYALCRHSLKAGYTQFLSGYSGC
ncbi:MAG: hypothetical protein DRO12_00740 [Thermoprotei archaeon]|nr:MAG: hypothetical protein DRO12_00740 [Thermoprotei archaeon]